MTYLSKYPDIERGNPDVLKIYDPALHRILILPGIPANADESDLQLTKLATQATGAHGT
jgi:hypothetical protein